MKAEILFLLVCCVAITVVACTQSSDVNSRPQNIVATSTPAPAMTPKNGDYDAKGVVTKVDTNLGSVGVDHEDIPGLMPPMQMEFFVQDKKMLEGLKVGDKIDFVIRYKDGSETIVDISRSK